MLYVTYNKDTRRVERIDDMEMIFNEDNLVTIEKDITFDDDICLNLGVYKVDTDNNFYIDEELVKDKELNTLRTKREPLLRAFDIYKSNLIVGVLILSEDEKQEVITWYNSILDLDADAINNPPEIISKYIQ